MKEASSVPRPLLSADARDQHGGYRLNSLRDRCRNIIALVNGVQDPLENDGELRIVVDLSRLHLPDPSEVEELFGVTQSHILGLQGAQGIIQLTPLAAAQSRCGLAVRFPTATQPAAECVQVDRAVVALTFQRCNQRGCNSGRLSNHGRDL